MSTPSAFQLLVLVGRTMRLRNLALLAVLLSCESVEGRRHRYGMWAHQRSGRHVVNHQSRALHPDCDDDNDDNILLSDLEDDVIEAATPLDKNWPPKWSQPVVIASALWWSSMFFS